MFDCTKQPKQIWYLTVKLITKIRSVCVCVLSIKNRYILLLFAVSLKCEFKCLPRDFLKTKLKLLIKRNNIYTCWRVRLAAAHLFDCRFFYFTHFYINKLILVISMD